MKSIIVLLGLVVLIPAALNAQIPADCVQCGGNPAVPSCSGGHWVGFITCWVSGGGCTTQDQCSYAGGPGCFVSGTLVETPFGVIPIEDLEVGDKVVGLSGGSAVVNEIVEVHRTLTVRYFIINDDISVTGTHPFLVGDGWVEAKSIRIGDTLVRPDGTTVPVTSVVPVDYGVRVFNISVTGNHTFFADGALVHNKTPNPGG